MKSGKLLKSFDLSDLEICVREVEGKSSRKDWESMFSIERAGKQYLELLC